jgi:hypothetical protein
MQPRGQRQLCELMFNNALPAHGIGCKTSFDVFNAACHAMTAINPRAATTCHTNKNRRFIGK